MSEKVEVYTMAILILTVSSIIGFALERLVLFRLKKVADKTVWKGDDLIISSLKGLLLSLGVILGLYFAFQRYPEIIGQKSIPGKLLFAAIAFLITVFCARFLVGRIKSKAGKAVGLIYAGSIIANVTRILVYLVGLIIILQILNIPVTPLLTALGVGGIAVALALQDTLSNLFSGIQVVASKQIKKGDYIKLDSGEEGYVADTTWRNTTIQMLSNNIIVIPNHKIATAIVTNYNLPNKEIAVLVEIGISYDSDLDKVERVTIEAARDVIESVEGGVKGFEPFIRYHTFADSGIVFTVILRAREFTDQYLLKHAFIKQVFKRYKESDIEIPFPIRTVILKNQLSN